MSVIHIRHIEAALHERFDGLIDVADYANHPADHRDRAFLSRAVAAFVPFALFDADETVAASAVTDESLDNGCDAMYHDPATHRAVIVQSKWDADGGSSPAVADVQKLIQGFQDLINMRFERFGPKMQRKIPEITSALDDPNTKFELVFAHTGQHPLSPEAKRLFDDLLGELNDVTEVVQYRILGQTELHSLVKGQAEGRRIDLEVALHDWGQTQEPFFAIYGQIEAEDVAAWWDQYGVDLFAKNLRRFVADSEVNEQIMASLRSNPEHFWYFNNGITVLCEKLTKKPIGGSDRRSGQFVCDGVSIVNGAQTVGCIGTVAVKDPQTVSQARVSVRFISIEACPPDFAIAVTRATNTQNRIERRDFVSLDPEQERLRSELYLDSGKIYAIKTGEPDPQPESGCSVTEATVALACASEDTNLAVQAKREIGRLWEDISKVPYKQIFNPGLTGLKMWRTVEIMRSVDRELRDAVATSEGKRRAVAIHGNRLLLHLVFEKMSVEHYSEPDLDLTDDLAKVTAIIPILLDRLTQGVEDKYGSNYVASLFKNATKCRDLVKAIA